MLRRLFVAIALVTGGVIAGGSVAHAACAGAAASYGGGTGTTADPYLISTPAHLERYLSTTADWSSSFRITTDLDMNGCSSATPYASFTGVFDGGYHSVSNLTITGDGFFPVLRGNAIVKNLGLNITARPLVEIEEDDDSYFTFEVNVGGLAGQAGPATRIENSWVSGTLTVDATYLYSGNNNASFQLASGGLVGTLSGIVVDSWSSMTVRSSLVVENVRLNKNALATHRVGGLVGWNLSSTINMSDVYSTGQVASVGTSSITNSGTGSLNLDLGDLIGIVGSDVMSDVVWTSEFWGAVGSGSPVGSLEKSTDELKDFATFGPAGLAWDIADGWSAATTWSICRQVNSGFPFHSGRYTTNPCVDPPGEPEPAALPWTPRIVDVVVRNGSVEVTFERVHMRQTTRWYEVQSLTSGTCRALHESVGATGTCMFDTRQTNAREQFRVIAHNAYGASDPSAWTPTAGVVIGRVAASPSPATTPAKPVASCPNGVPRTVTSGVRDVIGIDGAQCPVSVSVTPLRELGVAIAVPANGVASTYTLVASRRGGASVRRVWSAPNPGTLRTRIGPVKSGDWTLRLEVRSAEGRVTSWTSPVVRVP